MSYNIPADHHGSTPASREADRALQCYTVPNWAEYLEWRGSRFSLTGMSGRLAPAAPTTAEEAALGVLRAIGEDPSRGGLLETPERVAKAWQHWFSGYDRDPADVLKVFEDGAEGVDEMVLVKDIPFYSHCEHHMAPIFGTATVAYIPNGRIVGLSKLSRLVDIFARRLQVQERMTTQVADALVEHLRPHGVGVLVKARHLCMESRGVCQQGHHTVTTALRGVMREDARARAEFLGAAQ